MADVMIIAADADHAIATALDGALRTLGLRTVSTTDPRRADTGGCRLFVMTDRTVQSAAFIEAAVEAGRVRRAVIARFTYRPLPLSLHAAQTFGLIGWDGDPHAPEAEGLMTAVERIALAARERRPPAQAAATQAAPGGIGGYGGDEHGHDLDVLAEETAAWKAIQFGDDPEAFRAFLDRFGPESPFADLAQMKLDQLESEPPPPPRAEPAAAPRWTGWSVRPPNPEAPRPRVPERAPPPERPIERTQERYADRAPPPRAPERRPEPPSRTFDRRSEPPPEPPRFEPRSRPEERFALGRDFERAPEPPPRAARPIREPALEAPYDPFDDLPEPPPAPRLAPRGRATAAAKRGPQEGDGGAQGRFGVLAACALVAAALGVGLALLGGDPAGTDAQPEADVAFSYQEPINPDVVRSRAQDAGDPGSGSSLSEAAIAPDAGAAVAPSPRRAESVRPQLARPAETRVSEARRAEARPAAAATQPATSGSSRFTAAELQALAAQRAARAAQPSAPSTAAPRPETQGPEPIATGRTAVSAPAPALGPALGPAAAGAGASTQLATVGVSSLGVVTWAQTPSARKLQSLYPQRAADAGIAGEVSLRCQVQDDLRVRCTVASETPSRRGFGEAALVASRDFRAAPTLSNGEPAAGAESTVTIRFQAG